MSATTDLYSSNPPSHFSFRSTLSHAQHNSTFSNQTTLSAKRGVWLVRQPTSSKQGVTYIGGLFARWGRLYSVHRAGCRVHNALPCEWVPWIDLVKTLPERQPLHPVVKTEAVPQKVLLKDEKYIHETVDILAQLIDDANLHGDPQVKINYVQVKLLMHNYVIRMVSHNTMCMHTVYT